MIHATKTNAPIVLVSSSFRMANVSLAKTSSAAMTVTKTAALVAMPVTPFKTMPALRVQINSQTVWNAMPMVVVLALNLIMWMTLANVLFATVNSIIVFNALNNPALLAKQSTLCKIMHVLFVVISSTPAANATTKQLVPNA